MWGQFFVGIVSGVVSSLLVGIGLFVLLPRGAVLSRSAAIDVPDSWRVENKSSECIQLLVVKGLGAMTNSTPIEVLGTGKAGLRVELDDEVAQERAGDGDWASIRLLPGDGMTVHTPVNSTVRIGYRRAGSGGFLERRWLELSGTA